MLISYQQITVEGRDPVYTVRRGALTAHFSGILFVNGVSCQEESALFILEEFERSGQIPFDRIKGHYALVIVDENTKRKIVFTDNSGMFKSYVYENAVSTSFLDIARYAHRRPDDFSPSSVVEFFYFGHLYFGKTFFSDIRSVAPDEYCLFDGDTMRVLHKNIRPITAECTEEFLSMYYASLNSFVGKNLSLDVTGGVDSRLNIALFSAFGLPFELAVSGMDGNKDIAIARQVSHAVQRPFYPTFHDVEEIDDGAIFDEIFMMTDGMIDSVAYHRNHQMNMARKERGIEVAISGVGGELYKDFWWLQDFPFYRKASSDIRKLYDYRIGALPVPVSLFAEQYADKAAVLRDDTIAALSEFTLRTNTETYDNIYYNYKMRANAGAYISAASRYVPVYAPLVELDLVRFGFHLPRHRRFFNNFHREIISSQADMLAKIKTTEQVTVSSRTSDKIVDVVSYVFDKNKRMIKKILQKKVGKTFFQQSPQNRAIFQKIEELGLLDDSVDILRKCGVLRHDVRAETIPDSVKGKIVTVASLVRYLQ